MSMILRLIELDKEMKLGGKYMILARNPRGYRKKDNANFHATLIKKMENFYVFKADKGYLECVLKVDIITGDYKVQEV